MKISSQIDSVSSQTIDLDVLSQDALAFFTHRRAGHMGIWEYGPSLFPGDPAGGGAYWANLVKKPGAYYLTGADAETIQWATHQDALHKALFDVSAVIELGPGSRDSIVNKTLPLLQVCKRLKRYVAIDTTLEQAADAARLIKDKMPISVGISDHNYMAGPLQRCSQGKNAVVMWGSSLGNIEGGLGEDAFPKLVSILKNFKSGLRAGDILIISFDTEGRKDKILEAYNEMDLRASILSTLFRLERDGYVRGEFDPRVWNYEPVYNPDVGQCAHTVYPISEQILTIAGTTIVVPAWERFIANNSYKFLSSVVDAAARRAAFSTVSYLQKGPIAILLAEV